jgi:hypothetical protein
MTQMPTNQSAMTYFLPSYLDLVISSIWMLLQIEDPSDINSIGEVPTKPDKIDGPVATTKIPLSTTFYHCQASHP